MFGLGLLEIVILLFASLMCIGLPLGIVLAILLTQRKNK